MGGWYYVFITRGGKMINLSDKVDELSRIDFLMPYFVGNKLVEEVFSRYPSNSNLDEVILKVRLLNSFYNTNLEKEGGEVAIYNMAKKIVFFSEKNNLDGLIRVGDFSAIELIKGATGRKNLSFATKYCCISNNCSNAVNKDAYYIYDTLVCDSLYGYAKKNSSLFKEKITRERIKDYSIFFNMLEVYKKEEELQGTRRDCDWYIWGKEKLKKVGREI